MVLYSWHSKRKPQRGEVVAVGPEKDEPTTVKVMIMYYTANIVELEINIEEKII